MEKLAGAQLKMLVALEKEGPVVQAPSKAEGLEAPGKPLAQLIFSD